MRFTRLFLPVLLAIAITLPAAETAITIDASSTAAPISRNLFGKFTEHLGRNVYQGAWSQLVVNPEFAPARLWPNREVLGRRLETSAKTFNQPTLTRDSRFGLAAYYSAAPTIRGRLIEDRRRHVQELRTAPGDWIETGLYLPLHRVQAFKLTAKARAGESTTVTVQLLTANRRILGESTFKITRRWSNATCTIEAAAAGHSKGAPHLLKLIFPDEARIEIDRLLLFPTDHIEGWEPELVDFLRKAKLPMLRFPGGNFVSAYHWRDGIGPLDQRPVRPNPAWPELEWNHVGTDEWLRLCELTGAEPLICINAGNATSDHAAQWVEYVNGAASTSMGMLRAANGHPEPYNVRYWEIGNELYGAWQAGYTDGKGYAPRYREFYAEMKSIDPSILIIANGLGKLRRTENAFEPPEWNHELVKLNGDTVRSISVHPLEARSAPKDAAPAEVWRELAGFAHEYDDYLDKLVGEPMRRAGLTPKVAITEMQIFTRHANLPTNKSIAEALWLASMIHTCIRANPLVEMLTHSALLNHGGGLGKNRGILYAEPVWWTTHAYGSQPGTIPVSVTTKSPTFSTAGKWVPAATDVPYLDATALLAPDKQTLSVFIINRHPSKSMTTTLNLTGFQPAPTAQLWTLTADSLTARNTWNAPDTVSPTEQEIPTPTNLTLPPLSLTRLTLK